MFKTGIYHHDLLQQEEGATEVTQTRGNQGPGYKWKEQYSRNSRDIESAKFLGWLNVIVKDRQKVKELEVHSFGKTRG